MRLLNVKSKTLQDFVGDIPPYAILSHCWATEEITYQDICLPTGTAYKAGWAKIDGACNEAKEYGFDWIWIDTCCIDKTSSAELSEAINSMFSWYRDADICLAYLSDTKSGSAFGKSRWFTRGWTLQELLAPKVVYFYQADWTCLGDKETLAKTISDVTRIPQDVLVDVECLWYTSVARRMSWAAERHTTRVEDTAYCLMGIFGVHFPLLYGEGAKAFLRLQEEIIKISDDQSIFVWDTKDERQGALASSPADFTSAYVIASTPSSDESDVPYTMTHKGLSIRLPMYKTPLYYGSQPVYLGILNCHRENDFSRQIGIYLCATDTPDTKTFVRCKCRSSYHGTVYVEKVPRAEPRSIYIQNHSRVFYRRQPGLIVEVSSNMQDEFGYQLARAKVRGMRVSWNASSNVARIERTVDAFSHDVATGFVFYKPKTSEGFIVVVYFPHKKHTSTELAAIRLVSKPDDWPFDDWLQKTVHDLASNNIQETCTTTDKSDFPEASARHSKSSEQVFSAKLQPINVLNQTLYTLQVDMTDRVRRTRSGPTFLQGEESRTSPDSLDSGHSWVPVRPSRSTSQTQLASTGSKSPTQQAPRLRRRKSRVATDDYPRSRDSRKPSGTASWLLDKSLRIKGNG